MLHAGGGEREYEVGVRREGGGAENEEMGGTEEDERGKGRKEEREREEGVVGEGALALFDDEMSVPLCSWCVATA